MGATWEVKEEYRQIFLEESQDQIQEWEESLLALEKDPKDTDQIDTMFRAIHTLKGSAGFVGFKELQNMAHDLESALQYVRDEGVDLTGEMTEILFEGHDISLRMIEAFSLDEPFGEDIDEFMGRARSLEGVLQEEVFGAEKEEAAGEKDEEAGKEHASALQDEASADTKEAEGDGQLYRVGIEIEVEGKEAYLRSLFVQQRIEESGQLVEIKPPLNDLLTKGEEFKYDVFVRTEMTEEQLERALSLDQVKVTGVRKEEQESGEGGGSEGETVQVKESEGPKKQKEKRSGRARTEEVVRVPVEKLDV
ncbi:hypothetical protein LCGC14_2228620, partial [marine sediment metagenome]